jgi:hypothetical protein
MKTLETKIPDRLDRAIDALVEQGWFASRDDVVREAIRRFLDAHRPELMEKWKNSFAAGWHCRTSPNRVALACRLVVPPKFTSCFGLRGQKVARRGRSRASAAFPARRSEGRVHPCGAGSRSLPTGPPSATRDWRDYVVRPLPRRGRSCKGGARPRCRIHR